MPPHASRCATAALRYGGPSVARSCSICSDDKLRGITILRHTLRSPGAPLGLGMPCPGIIITLPTWMPGVMGTCMAGRLPNWGIVRWPPQSAVTSGNCGKTPVSASKRRRGGTPNTQLCSHIAGIILMAPSSWQFHDIRVYSEGFPNICYCSWFARG